MKIKKILNNVGLSFVAVGGIVTMSSCGNKNLPPTPIPPLSPVTGIYAPFVDIAKLASATNGHYTNLVDYYINPGVRNMMLGYVQQGAGLPNPHAEWAGSTEIGDNQDIIDAISHYQNVGGNVSISFGGSKGTSEWTLANASATNLASDIMRVADKFETKYIDFDIQGNDLTNVVAIAKLANACKQILEKDPEIRFTLTLPVSKIGLSKDAIAVVTSFYAITKFNTIVNIMAKNYGGPVADMEEVAKQASNATAVQIALAYGITNAQAYKLLGVSPMIGYNDSAGEVMSLEQYFDLGTYLRNKHAFMYGQWYLNRDYASVKEGQSSATSTGLLPSEAADLSFTHAGLISFGDKGAPSKPVEGFIELTQYLITQRDFGAYWTEVKNAIHYKIIVDNDVRHPYYSLVNNLILENGAPNYTSHTFQVTAVGINDTELDSETLTVGNSNSKNTDLTGLVTRFKKGTVYNKGDLFLYEKIIYHVSEFYNGAILPDQAVKSPNSQVNISKITLANLAQNGYSQQAVEDFENDRVFNVVKLT